MSRVKYDSIRASELDHVVFVNTEHYTVKEMLIRVVTSKPASIVTQD